MDLIKINAFFLRLGQRIVRWRISAILGTLLLLALACAGLPRVQSDTNQENYFLEGDPLLQIRDHFENIFGNDDFCGVLAEAPDVFDPEFLRLLRRFGKALKQEVPYADDVLSLTDLEFIQGSDKELKITELVPDPVPNDAASREEMRRKAMSKPSIKGKIVSEDSRYTWIMLRLKRLPHNAKDERGWGLDQVIGEKVNLIAARPEFSPLHLKTSGLPVINADKRAFIASEMPTLFGLSLFFTVAVLALSLRSVRGVLFPLFCAVAGLGLVFGVQGWLGIVNDPSMIFLPVFLSLAMALAYSIYYVNDFKAELFETGLRREAATGAVERSGWPIGFSALTTMVGLLSFCFVPLKPIRWMGLTAAALVGVLYLLTLFLLPAMISFGRRRIPRKAARVRQSLSDALVDRLSRSVLKRPGLSLLLCLIVFLASLAGLKDVNISFDMRDTYGMAVPYVKRICEVADSPLGSLYAYGIGIEFREQDMAKRPENLRRLEQFVQEVSDFPLTKRVSSVIDILKDLNKTLNANDDAKYIIPDTQEQIAQQLLLYENSGGVEAERWIDYEYSRLRLLVEMGDYKSAEAARELETIYRRGRELFPDADILLTGSIAQFSVMQDYVSWGQIKSFFLSVLAVSLLMCVTFASLRIGLIAMIPNIAPALLSGACMGFFGFPLDVMTVTVMPMLLGLAVDDTIHFINGCKYWFLQTGDYAESVRRTFILEGKSMLQTSIVLALCFLTYMASSVAVFQRLGILVAIGAMAALAADYFVTPVLIQKFQVFGPERRGKKHGRPVGEPAGRRPCRTR